MPSTCQDHWPQIHRVCGSSIEPPCRRAPRLGSCFEVDQTLDHSASALWNTAIIHKSPSRNTLTHLQTTQCFPQRRFYVKMVQIKLGHSLLLPHTVCFRKLFAVGRLGLPVSHFPHLHLLLDLQWVNNNVCLQFCLEAYIHSCVYVWLLTVINFSVDRSKLNTFILYIM